MDILMLLLAVVSVLNLFLGFLVFTRDPKEITHRAFLALCLSFVLWGGAIAFMFVTKDVVFARATFFAGVGMGYFLVVFTSNFPNQIRYPLWARIFSAVLGAFFLPFAFTDYILVQYSPTQIIGPLFIPYMVWIGSYFLWGFVNLIIQYRKSRKDEIRRRQITFVFLGIGIMLTFAFITNGILPVLEGAPNYVQFSPLFSVAFIACTAIAVLRYHMFNIKVILAESMVALLILILLIETSTSESVLSFVKHIVIVSSATVMGSLLVLSVQAEVRRREELAELTRQLSLANEKLKKLDAQKTEFLSIASHQLRTPLAAMRGYLELLMDGTFGPMKKDQTEIVEKIHNALQGMVNLVGELLTVSRIESGKSVMQIETVDLPRACAEVTDFFSGKAKENGLQLICVSTPVPPVTADPGKLKEVIMNLTENALKYTEEGEIRISFVEEPKYVRVEVRDTGIGIKASDINKLFKKFSRLGEGTMHTVGTGLGLYVCKKLIEAMGGEIWAESNGLKKGSTFVFRLPKASKETKKSLKARGGGGRR